MPLSSEDRERVRALIEELDRLVPKEGARVFAEVPDETPPPNEEEYASPLVANELGYLRLAVEMGRAGFAPTQEGSHRVPVDLSYLGTSSGDRWIQLGEHVRIERLSDLPEPPPPTLTDKIRNGLWSLGCATVLGFFLYVVVLGFVALFGRN